MSARNDNGSHYEGHERAAELHRAAAHAHRVAAVAHEKQDHQSGHELTRQALEHSQEAYKHTKQAQVAGVNGRGQTSGRREDIAALAHQLWKARGCPDGSPDEDWFHAAHELRVREESLQK